MSCGRDPRPSGRRPPTSPLRPPALPRGREEAMGTGGEAEAPCVGIVEGSAATTSRGSSGCTQVAQVPGSRVVVSGAFGGANRESGARARWAKRPCGPRGGSAPLASPSRARLTAGSIARLALVRIVERAPSARREWGTRPRARCAFPTDPAPLNRLSSEPRRPSSAIPSRTQEMPRSLTVDPAGPGPTRPRAMSTTSAATGASTSGSPCLGSFPPAPLCPAPPA